MRTDPGDGAVRLPRPGNPHRRWAGNASAVTATARAARGQLALPGRLPHLRRPGGRSGPGHDSRQRFRGVERRDRLRHYGPTPVRQHNAVRDQPGDPQSRCGHPRGGERMTDTETLLAFDRKHLWHPYTSMTDHTPTRLVTGASGSRITVDGVGDVVDGMASWWSAIHGYRHPTLDTAVREQLDTMAHVMFGGLTHEPAVRLAHRLVELSPPGLDRVFLADSGSVGVEVAMKMALQYQRGRSAPHRDRFLTVRGGYHGDTFDGMSVCDPDGGMHSMWSGVLPQQVFGERPPPPGGDVATWEAGFRSLAAAHAEQLAGL